MADERLLDDERDEFFARVGADKPTDDDVRQQVRRQVQVIVERIKNRTHTDLTPK